MSRPWMPLYVADYLADTLDLRADETGVYLLMLMIAWRRPDGALPNDMKWLQRALSSCARDMHGNRFNRLVPPLLERFFVLGEDDKFRNKRLTKEREKAEKFSEKQRENVNKRYADKSKNNDLADTNVVPARASQSQSQSQRKEEDAPDGAPSGKVYAFESGVIRLNQHDFDLWKASFTNLDVGAELLAMTEWAGQQRSWFNAVKGALNKKNQQAKERKAQQIEPRWNGIEGVL
jgi:uncharacterized protein YdaU (DUF1376 family)